MYDTRATTSRRWLPLTLAMALLFALAAPAAFANHLEAGPPTTTHNVQPVSTQDHNPKCGDLIAGSVNFEPPGSDGAGTHNVTLGSLSGTLTVTPYMTAQGQAFDFSFTGAIGAEAVVVKGGNGANFYDYRAFPGGGVMSDTFLHAPFSPEGGDTFAGLSHLSFCLVELVNPSTTLSMDVAGATVDGDSNFDPLTNTLTVYEGAQVTVDATETNDGNVDLTDASVEFAGVACAGGNVKNIGNLAAGASETVSCTFTATGDTTVTATGNGFYNGINVTWFEGCVDSATVLCDEDEYDEFNLVTINPSTDLDLDVLASSPSTQTGVNPKRYTVNVDYGGDVDLTFVELNNGDEDLTNVYIEFINGAPECDDSVSEAGNVTLAPTETHTVTCDTIVNVTAHRTITAIGHGIDPLGNDVTWCNPALPVPDDTLCDQDEIVIVDIIVNFGEGCTPGLWGQYDNELGRGKNVRFHWIRAEWADSPYSFDNNAGATFGVAVWDPYTLGELTNRGGGGEAALGRAASAALQNILHPDIQYFGYPTGQAGADMLIAEVQAAFADGGDAIETLKNKLDDLNNEGDCTLSNS